MHRVKSGSTAGRWLILIAVVGAFALQCSGARPGDVSVVLQSHKYYAHWDLTEFVYRVRTRDGALPESFVLGTGTCVEASSIFYTVPWPSWVEEPFAGLAFDINSSNQKIYLWLFGQWDAEDVDVALLFDWGWHGISMWTGRVQGPYCESAALSLSVVEGSSLVFPEITGSGTYPVVGGTTLRVSSSSSNWALSHSVAFEIPPGASEEVVTRILEVVYDAHSPKSGATDIGVSYALIVEETDFAGLPEGEYVIHITFTAAEN